MEKEIWFASNNKNKVIEMKALLEPQGYKVKSLFDLDKTIDIIEDGKNYTENALIKARTLSKLVSASAIGDDTGLEIKALNNFPGLNSNRWKGGMSFFESFKILFARLKPFKDRTAKMVTVLAYVDLELGEEQVFEGEIIGQIIDRLPKEPLGFGYDQIFYVPSLKQTLFEIGPDLKNKISHRAIATVKLIDFLKTK